MGGAGPRPAGDDEVITAWGVVIEGYVGTQARVMGEVATQCGLQPAPFDILLRLLRTPGCRLPMTQLAREAALSSGGFTKVADRLVAAGLLCREPSAHDRRVVYAVLTEPGRALADRARRVCAEAIRRYVLEPLGPEPATALGEAMQLLRARHSG
ncbi:MAG: MarR family winged helix-turn-helix transcriptional regulator [Candidatus Dormiibacterota bacterium]